jgi:hypothetical protein
VYLALADRLRLETKQKFDELGTAQESATTNR